MSDIFTKTLCRAAFLSVFLHAGIVFAILSYDAMDDLSSPEEIFLILSVYDPLGGEPGLGMDGLLSPFVPFEEPMEEFFEEPPIMEDQALLESEKGELTLDPFKNPPPKEEIKRKDKPKEKPKTSPLKTGPETGSAANFPAPPAGGSLRGIGEGGFGGGTGKGTKKLLDAYVSKVQFLLERNKKYPSRADRKSGVVELNFTILKDGAVIGEKIVSSSGYEAFDLEALSLIKRVSPFAPIPTELGRERINLTLPVMFVKR